MRRKPTLIAAAGMLLAGSLVACSATPMDTDGAIVFQGAYENHPGEPFDLAMNRWAELLEDRSEGSMRMELFPSSQLGSKSDLMDQMYAGSPVITLADGAFYADQGVPDFGIVFAPFLFENWDEAWALTRSDWYAEQSAELEEIGLKILVSNWIYGERHTLLTQPIDGVDDLRGRKIRVPANVIQVKGFEALGATPTPMALGDVYTSLQQGTIDGLENPIPVLQNGKFHEVARYLVLDGHVMNFTTLLTGTNTYELLTDEQKQILEETGVEAGVYNNEQIEIMTQEALDTMIEEGVTVLDDVDIDEFRDRARSFYEIPEIEEMFSDGLYETVREAIEDEL